MPRSHRAPLPLKQGFQVKVPAEYGNGEKYFNHLIRISLAGDAGVGRSCLLLRYTDDTYTESYIENIGVDFKFRTCRLDSDVISVQVWDAIPSHRRSLADNEYLGRDAIILAFDLSDADSFNNLKLHLGRIERVFGIIRPIILVGTKSDLQSKRKIYPEDVKTFIEQSKGLNPNIIDYIEVSAKTGAGVERVFEVAIKAAMAEKKRLNMPKNGSPKQIALKAGINVGRPSQRRTEVGSGRQSLVDALETYIKRIESHHRPMSNDINFRYGFWFYANSRAANRKANYLLAKSLLNDLYHRFDCSIEEIFSQIREHRADIIETEKINEMQGYVSRDINSHELKAIIDSVLMPTEHQVNRCAI